MSHERLAQFMQARREAIGADPEHQSTHEAILRIFTALDKREVKDLWRPAKMHTRSDNAARHSSTARPRDTASLALVTSHRFEMPTEKSATPTEKVYPR